MISGARSERYPLFERRPALTLLLTLVAGITVGDRLAHPELYFPFVAAAVCAGLAGALVLRRHPLPLLCCTAVASFLFGVTLISATRLTEAHAYLANVDEGECRLTGVIAEVRHDDHLYFRLDCDSIISDQRGSHPTLNEAAGVFLRVTDSSKEMSLVRGMRVNVFGELVQFGSQRNP